MTRNFLKLADLALEEHRALFARAAELKRRRRAHQPVTTLANRTLVLVMEKASTRTRLSFAAAMGQLGGHAIELGAGTSQLARGEPLADTARVISGYADAVVVRTSTDARLAEFVAHASIPVINGLTDIGHPVQVLTDLFTIQERFGSVSGRVVAWVGDGASNMARSFLEATALFDFELRIAAPEGYRPSDTAVAAVGGRVHVTSDPREAVRGADVVSTDVWTSMGQETESAVRLAALGPYVLDAQLLARADPAAVVLHCLPSHRGEEITAEVLEGSQSLVFEQAENRLHVQKALLEQLLLH